MSGLRSAGVSMTLHSLWSAGMALALMAIALWRYFSGLPGSVEMLYFMALALFHGIFAIWYWQGRQLAEFVRCSVAARLLTGGIYWFSAWLLHASGDAIDLPDTIIKGYLVYLILQGAVDLAGSILTGTALAGPQQPASQSPEPADKKLSLEIKNRFAFALYMLFLGAWVLLATESFLAVFHLPATHFPDWDKTDAFIPGPVHLFAVQVIVLAIYNLVAVRYRLTSLINAGIRGGLFTCVFVLVLVLAGILHPITLLLPAVDLISVALILSHRFIGLVKSS